jgi:hypothetical protein
VRRVAGIGGPTVVDEQSGQAYVGYVDAGATVRIGVLDAATGLPRHVYALGSNGDAFLSGLVEDPATGAVFATTFFGLQELDPATGRTAVLDPATPSAIDVDGQRARLFAAFAVNRNHYGIPVSPGEIAMFDTVTGARLAAIRVGVGPDTVVVDGSSGDVYVLDTLGLEVVRPGASTAGVVQTSRPPDPAPAQLHARYFASTHHNLSGQFLSFWLDYGGLPGLGNPISEPFEQDAHLSQYLERALLQIVNGIVVPAPLGRVLTSGRTFAPVPAFVSGAGKLYFAQTRHTLSGAFLAYWKTRHGDVLLGAPISEVVSEANGDGTGREYPTQWFENGRLEYHAELAGTPYAVEVGLVGLQVMREQSWFG